MQRFLSIMIALLGVSVMPLGAWAKPSLVVETSTALEVVEKVDGREVHRIVPTTQVEPGQTLIYTIKYRNDGDEKATNVVINNPIPKDTVYLVGSATGLGSSITFSIDGGKNFKQPTLLTYEITEPDGRVVNKVAAPEEYTHVQWIVREVAPGQHGEVSFQVKVK